MKRLTSRRKRLRRFIEDVVAHTPFIQMLFLLVGLWLVFSTAIYFAESGAEDASIKTLGEALYWGWLLFQLPVLPIHLCPVLPSCWVLSGLFSAQCYFLVLSWQPLLPISCDPCSGRIKIIDTIEYNLEQMDDLTVEELDLLKETVDTLIAHVEQLKEKQSSKKEA